MLESNSLSAMIFLNPPACKVVVHGTIQLNHNILLHHNNSHLAMNSCKASQSQRTFPGLLRELWHGHDLRRNNIDRHIHPHRPPCLGHSRRDPPLSDLRPVEVNPRGRVVVLVRGHVRVLDRDIHQKRDVGWQSSVGGRQPFDRDAVHLDLWALYVEDGEAEDDGHDGED